MSSQPPPLSSGQPYAEGDLILVEQGGKLHEAKVLKLGDGRSGQDVFVHYQGWNKKWDSWALLTHTRPIDAETRAEQARMAADFDNNRNASNKKQKKREAAGMGTTAITLQARHSCKRRVWPVAVPCLARSLTLSIPVSTCWLVSLVSCTDPPAKRSQYHLDHFNLTCLRVLLVHQLSAVVCAMLSVRLLGRAARAEPASEASASAIAAATKALKTDEELMSSELVPPLPSVLRRRLILDWEWLTRRQHIQRLPARLPVLTLLAAFLHDHHASQALQPAAADSAAAKQEAVMQVCEGLLCYFERCLPAVLLYRIERPQMQQLAQQHNLSVPVPGQPTASPLFSLQHITRTLPRPPAADVQSSSSSSPSSSTSASRPTALTHWLPAPSADTDSFSASTPQWSGVYGCEHLIRMLCKLPAILRDGETEWLDEQRQAVRYTLTALYKWLSLHDELIDGYSVHEQPDGDYMFKLQQPHHAAHHADEQQHSNGDKTVDLRHRHSLSTATGTVPVKRKQR